MHQLLNEISTLSDNSAVFDHLRVGCDLTALATLLADSFAVPHKTVKGELLDAFCHAIVLALQANDHSSLDNLIDDADIHARVTIFGELILTLYALRDGKHSDEMVDAILQRAFQVARDLAGLLEAAQPQDTDDEQLLAHGIAMREWAHLLAGYYQAAGLIDYAAEMLMVRARVTNNTLSVWPHLVGPAMIDLAIALESIGKVDIAIKCYNGVRMDLDYLIDRIDDPAFPDFEKVAALYWLHRACEEFCRLVPTDTDAAHQLQRVHDLRKERGYPDDISAPRFGPIAKTYLDKTPYLALIIRDLQVNGENVAVICQRYGCPSLDVDFYLSAMGSYVIRDTILRDVHIYYDEAHHEVFAAIDYLQHQNQQTGTDGAEQNTPGNSSHE